MKNLWRPIEELTDIYQCGLLLRAPELVDLDCNPHGVAPGYWQDGGKSGDVQPGEWLCARWSMTNDEWYEQPCQPTHFILMEGPPLLDAACEDSDGVDPTTPELLKPRGNNGVVNASICSDALLLTGLTNADTSGWNQNQLDTAYDWAVRVHLNASDNDDVLVPPRPEHVAG